MPKLDNTVSTKVADSTLSRIEEFADTNGMSRSEAIRNRLRQGLDEADAIPGAHVSYGALLAAFGLIFASMQYVEAGGFTGPLGLALLALALVHDGAYWLGLK
jgi:Flp pilus assembly protein TadB